MIKRIVIAAMLLFCARGQGAFVSAQQRSAQPESMIGTVVAYDHLLQLFQLTNIPPALTLIIRIEPAAGEPNVPRYIQVRCGYSPKEFPHALLETRTLLRLSLARDRDCDHQIVESTDLLDERTGKPTGAKIPLWRILVDAERESIPFGTTLPCYEMDNGAYQAIPKR